MKKIAVILLLIALFSTFCVSAVPQPPEGTFAEVSQALVFGGEDGMRYRLYVPADYEQVKYPIAVNLHGSGERGTNNTAQLNNHFVTKLFNDYWERFPCIMLIPQCPNDVWWDPVTVMELIDSVAAEYNADTDRIYLAGFSMGGYGIYDILRMYPDRIAAAFPICGGNGYWDVEKFKDVPMWISHGELDANVPVEDSRMLVEQLEALRAKSYIYTEIEGASHFIWDRVYDYLEGYQWMFAQNLNNRPKDMTTTHLMYCTAAAAVILAGIAILVRKKKKQ